MMLIRDGENGGKGVWRWGEGEILYLSLRCRHQNDSRIKMGSDKRHFDVSLTVRDKVTNKTVFTDHNFWRERRAKADLSQGPSACQPNALPLGQTSSRDGGGNSGSLIRYLSAIATLEGTAAYRKTWCQSPETASGWIIVQLKTCQAHIQLQIVLGAVQRYSLTKATVFHLQSV